MRTGGVSVGTFASLNLGTHVGDDAPRWPRIGCACGRRLQLPREPLWLNQVHGTTVVEASSHELPPTADAFVRAIAPARCAPC